MDKIAANNHFVLLRKEIKKAKAMVAGNLIRKINKLKEDKEKEPDEQLKCKFDDKIERIYAETKLIKGLDPYTICKKVTLKPDVKHWDHVISDSKSTAEDRLGARIMCKNNIQKQVAKFRDDQKDCDEWLEEYFEYREKKKALEDAAKKTKNNPKRAIRNFENDKKSKRNNRPERLGGSNDKNQSSDKNMSASGDSESLHPSWASKRKEKELLKAALSGEIRQSKRIILNE